MKKIFILASLVLASLLVSCSEGKNEYNHGTIAEQARKYDEAIEAYKNVIKEYPDGAYAPKARERISEIYLGKARANIEKGSVEKAMEEYDKAAAIFTDDMKEHKSRVFAEKREKAAEAVEQKFLVELKANSGVPDVAMSPDSSELTLYFHNDRKPDELARFFALGKLFGERRVKSSLFDRYANLTTVKLISHSPRPDGTKLARFVYVVTRDMVKDIPESRWDDMRYMYRDALYYAQPGKLYGTGEVDIETNYFAVKFLHWAEEYAEYQGQGRDKMKLKLPPDPGADDAPKKRRKRAEEIEF